MLIALFIALDHCRRMHAGRSAECIAPKNGVVVRNSPPANSRSRLAILAKSRKVVVNPFHQFQVYQQLIQRLVTHSFPNTESRAVYLIRPTLNRRYGVDYSQPTILMSVPIQSDFPTLFLNNAFYEPYHRTRAIRSRVADCVADANGLRATTNGCRVKCPNDVRVSSRRILGHVHNRNAFTDGKRHRFLSHL